MKQAIERERISTTTAAGYCKDDSPSRIRDQVTRIENIASELYTCMDALEMRLTTVLQTVPPQVANAGSAPMSSGSHLFERLQTLAMDAEGVVRRLNELMQRVEV